MCSSIADGFTALVLAFSGPIDRGLLPRAVRGLLEFLQVRAELRQLRFDAGIERGGRGARGPHRSGGARRCSSSARRSGGRRRGCSRRFVGGLRAHERCQIRVDLRVRRLSLGVRRDQLIEVGDELRELRPQLARQLLCGRQLCHLAERVTGFAITYSSYPIRGFVFKRDRRAGERR